MLFEYSKFSKVNIVLTCKVLETKRTQNVSLKVSKLTKSSIV